MTSATMGFEELFTDRIGILYGLAAVSGGYIALSDPSLPLLDPTYGNKVFSQVKTEML